MKYIVRSVPATLFLVAVLWLTFAAFGSSARARLGFDLPADPHLWHLVTSGLTGPHAVGLVYYTVAALVFAVPAERVLGTRRFVVAAICSHAVAVPTSLILGSAVEHAGFNQWGADLANGIYLSPVAWIFGPLAYATSQMGVLWRRRLRLVLVALTGSLVLYAGSLSSVGAFAAVLLAWGAGALTTGPRRPVFHTSQREARVLVAAAFVSVAVGPVVTALNPGAQGPFAGVSQLMWEPTVAAHEVADRCRDAFSFGCMEAIAINQQHGVGPLLLNLLPLALAVVLAVGLARGRRLAWGMAVAFALSSLGVVGFQVGRDSDDVVSHINAVLVVLPWCLLLATLLATARRFRVTSVWRPALTTAAGTFLATAAVWVVGALLLKNHFLTTPAVNTAVAELPARYMPPAVAVLLPHYLVPRTTAAWALYEWVGVVFWAVALFLLYRVLSSPPSSAAESDRAAAREILVAGTGDHIAWMGLWAGNRYFFHGDSGYVAYRVSRGVAVTVGGPVWTADTSAAEVAEAFEGFAAEQGWRVAWYSVSESFSRPGFRRVHVAEESLLYTDNLEFKGKKFQNIRTARNRAAKEGVRAVWTSWAGCDVEMREKIVALSEQWVADKALPEMGFTLGGLDELGDPDTRLLLALDGAGRLHGVTSWLPVYENGALVGYTLDFMRRDAEGFRPVVEYLLAEAAVVAGEQGLSWVSLSGAPLSRTGTPDSLVEVLLDKTGAVIEPLYGFRSLAASKYKFHPTHCGWYMAYDDEMALPAIALAVVGCYLPDLNRADVVAVAREFLARRQEAEPDHAAASTPGAAPTPRP